MFVATLCGPELARFQSAAASWTRRNGSTRSGARSKPAFQSAAASWTRRNIPGRPSCPWRRSFNPPPRRGRGGIRSTCGAGPGSRSFNPPPRRGRGGIGSPRHSLPLEPVSIRRRVVDAAESWTASIASFSWWFQSAAASWTRRNGRGVGWLPLHSAFQSAAASWTRRNRLRRALDRAARSFNPPPRRGRGGIWGYKFCWATPGGFNPPPRRGRGGIARFLLLIQSRIVSIRRRVVDAAEFLPDRTYPVRKNVSIRRRVVDAAELARKNGKSTVCSVSIRRRVVDAAESGRSRDGGPSPGVSIRRRVVDAAEC